VAALAVSIVTAVPALREVWMVPLFATADAAIGVKTLGLPPLKVPPLVAALETETSLAAWRWVAEAAKQRSSAVALARRDSFFHRTTSWIVG
jgi:hypothetical protein